MKRILSLIVLGLFVGCGSEYEPANARQQAAATNAFNEAVKVVQRSVYYDDLGEPELKRGQFLKEEARVKTESGVVVLASDVGTVHVDGDVAKSVIWFDVESPTGSKVRHTAFVDLSHNGTRWELVKIEWGEPR